MNAVEIEEAVSHLFAEPYNAAEFPFQFLEAFANKETTIKKLRSGSTNQSDVGGVLQRNNIHILTTDPDQVSAGLIKLKLSPANAKHKCEFILTTDGKMLEAENLLTGESLACEYEEFPDHFGFFLSLAGISTVASIRENSFDIKAVGHLNRLYLELLKENPEWKEGDLRHEMNRFLVRLVFCFYAEDTHIFPGDQLFSKTIALMSERNAENTNEIIAEIFRAMSIKDAERDTLDKPLARWARKFPYVNGGLFSDAGNVPHFTPAARSYITQIAGLDWRQVNPDIFGSMIQGVANDSERSNLGMHYTSVPNILKVLNPLFLDDLRQHFENAKGNARKLTNLKKRLQRIRIFDPACGSGNFLLIAYKEMRAIEHDINVELDTPLAPSIIPITNFRGIELEDFAAEIARLSLVIAEFQCNAKYMSETLALSVFLPLSKRNWIICGNALRLDWLEICPPEGTGVKIEGDDLFSAPLDQFEIDFENEGGETYICGNPPYLGREKMTENHKSDIEDLCHHILKKYKKLDYVAGWIIKAFLYCQASPSSLAAFVTTNSICQGAQVELLWPTLFSRNIEIKFGRTSFKWKNLASHNAGVTVVVICIGHKNINRQKLLFSESISGEIEVKRVPHINPYLLPGMISIVTPRRTAIAELAPMVFGSKPSDGGNLILSLEDAKSLNIPAELHDKIVFKFVGSDEICQGKIRFCLWIEEADFKEVMKYPSIAERIDKVREMRENGSEKGAKKALDTPYAFREIRTTPRSYRYAIVVPSVTSENRPYLPCGILGKNTVVNNLAFALYDAPLWNMALIASRLHLVWIQTVCGKLETRFRYSNTLGWNTFPVPTLTEKNKADLTESAIRILEIRERYFPETIANLYDNMPDDLRQAHEWNDEVVERIFIGRKFKNDSERLEKLFEMYARLTSAID